MRAHEDIIAEWDAVLNEAPLNIRDALTGVVDECVDADDLVLGEAVQVLGWEDRDVDLSAALILGDGLEHALTNLAVPGIPTGALLQAHALVESPCA